MCIDYYYLSSSVLAISQQYINIETVSKSMSLPYCSGSVTADNIVIFLTRDGQVYTDKGQGFVTVCLKKNSSSYGWAFIRDDHMTDRIRLGVMYICSMQTKWILWFS